MRVLMVNDYAPDAVGGAEVYLSRLVDALRDAGDEVALFAGEIRHRGAARALDIWDPFARVALIRVARRFRPDVVHHHNVLRELSVSVLGVPAGTATVLTVHDHRVLGVPDRAHGSILGSVKAARSRFDISIVRRRVHVATAPSRELVRRLLEAGLRDVAWTPGFAPVAAIDPVPVGDAADVVFVGRLGRDKGPLTLASAFELVASRHPLARLVIAGDGPERDALNAVASRLGPDRVLLAGTLAQDSLRAVMARARVVVVPSIPTLRREGSPLTVVEAAMLGRPLIVSDDAGLREFIDRSGGGIVVEPDSPAALADALERVLSSPDEAALMGGRARRAAEAEHTPAAVVPLMKEVYARAFAAARAKSGDRR